MLYSNVLSFGVMDVNVSGIKAVSRTMSGESEYKEKIQLENGTGNVGTRSESATVLNKKVAAELTTITDIVVKFSDGYKGGPTSCRTIFMI